MQRLLSGLNCSPSHGRECRLTSLKCLGGFRNVRSDYKWPHAVKLELDETLYEWGTVYEIEVETVRCSSGQFCYQNVLSSMRLLP